MHHIVPPHMWFRHTVRKVGLPHLGFPFPVGLPPSYRSLQGYSYLTFPSLVGPRHSELHYSPYMWVRHTVRNVGLPHLIFPFPAGPPPSYRSLQGYSYLTFPSLVGPPHGELHYSP